MSHGPPFDVSPRGVDGIDQRAHTSEKQNDNNPWMTSARQGEHRKIGGSMGPRTIEHRTDESSGEIILLRKVEGV